MKNKYFDNNRIRELFRYGFFGMVTTAVNIIVYQFLLLFFNYKISNLVAILTSKLFAYVTNKWFVFHSKCNNKKELFQELCRFILARGATGLFDYFSLIIAVDVFQLNRVWSKYGIQVIVIVLNYILGEKTVFINKVKVNDIEEKK